MSQPLDSEFDDAEDEIDPDSPGAQAMEMFVHDQSLWWEWFEENARKNPHYGPWLPLVVEPVTQEEYGASFVEANRLTKLAQGQIGSNTPADQSDVKQAHREE